MATNTTPFKLIKAGCLIDGRGGPPIEQAVVLIEGSIIRQVGPETEISAPEGAQVAVYDYSRKTVLPGLVDAHTHMNLPGDGTTGDEVGREQDDILLLRSVQNARAAIMSGVTTARENGAKNRTAFALKEGINRGIVIGPRMLPTGRPLTITGGHMEYFGGECDGVDEVRKAVRQLIKEGADYIKIAATGGSTVTSYPFAPAFNADELKAIVDETHNFGKLTAAHCRSSQGIINSLDAGVDMIVHCFFYEFDASHKYRPDIVEKIVKAGAWVNPTIAVARASVRHVQRKKEETLTPEEERLLEAEVAIMEARASSLDARMEDNRRMIEAGVKLVAGSDSAWGHYPAGQFYQEIEVMAEAGLSNMQAILCGTKDSAKSLGVDNIVGTLEVDKEADILVVDGNPLNDILALGRVEAVFKGGMQIR